MVQPFARGFPDKMMCKFQTVLYNSGGVTGISGNPTLMEVTLDSPKDPFTEGGTILHKTPNYEYWGAMYRKMHCLKSKTEVFIEFTSASPRQGYVTLCRQQVESQGEYSVVALQDPQDIQLNPGKWFKYKTFNCGLGQNSTLRFKVFTDHCKLRGRKYDPSLDDVSIDYARTAGVYPWLLLLVTFVEENGQACSFRYRMRHTMYVTFKDRLTNFVYNPAMTEGLNPMPETPVEFPFDGI